MALSKAPTKAWQGAALLALVWMGLMLWGCLSEVGQGSGLLRQWLPWLAQQPHLDKWAHGAMHAVLALLLCRAWRLREAALGRSWGWSQAAVVLLFCAAFGGAIEVMQWAFTQTRSAEWLDELANIAGAALASGLFTWLMGNRGELAKK